MKTKIKGKYIELNAAFFRKTPYGAQLMQLGRWEYNDGEDGGTLEVTDGELTDSDGAYDLPNYVKQEIRSYGITVD